jgi:hypothetical protein
LGGLADGSYFLFEALRDESPFERARTFGSLAASALGIAAGLRLIARPARSSAEQPMALRPGQEPA